MGTTRTADLQARRDRARAENKVAAAAEAAETAAQHADRLRLEAAKAEWDAMDSAIAQAREAEGRRGQAALAEGRKAVDALDDFLKANEQGIAELERRSGESAARASRFFDRLDAESTRARAAEDTRLLRERDEAEARYCQESFRQTPWARYHRAAHPAACGCRGCRLFRREISPGSED